MINLKAEDKKWVDSMWDRLESKLSKSAVELRDIIPYTTIDGKYDDKSKIEPDWWTNGFFGGLMWLMYNATKNEEFRKTAENQEKLLDKGLEKFELLHHDVGFMWGLTSKAQYMLTGNEKSRQRALYAAATLAARANVKGKFIRAWNGNNITYSIIDCLMNIPFLYWASREIGDDRFKYVALMHADMAAKEHVREDGSVVHICVHDDHSEKVVETLAGQGYAVGSAWSRGQAWAVYGFMLNYIHTGDKNYLDACIKVTDYFLEGAKKNGYRVPTDFNQPKEPEYIDTSAAVCAACGMIELYKETKEEKYLDGALKLLKGVEQDCVFDDSNQAILQNGMESYGAGKQLHLIYADFFLCEALTKLKNIDFLIW